MKFCRWCVTVADNWTPTREFFTLNAALRWRLAHGCASLFKWEDGEWREVGPVETVSLLVLQQ